MLRSIHHILFLLDTVQRQRLITLAGMTLVGAVLEVIGIGLVLPVMLLLVGQTRAEGLSGSAMWLAGLLPEQVSPTAVVTGLLLLLAVFVVKNLFLGLLAARQMYFAGALQESLSQRLFALYMRQPYAFHLRRNSTELLRNAVIEVDQLTSKAIMPLLSLIVEGLFGLATIAVLILLEPVGAILSMLIVAGAGWSLYALMREPSRRWAEQRQHHEGERLQQFQHGLHMVKEIKILGREETLLARFRRHGNERARAVQYYETLQRLPRLWFEVLFVASVVAVTVLLLVRGTPAANVAPILGVFAAAAFRFIPSVSRMLGSAQSIAHAGPVAGMLHDEVTELSRHAEALPPAADPTHRVRELTLENVAFRHADATVPSLDGINLTISRGERIGITGSSGAGKSTLLDLLMGLLPPSRGAVRADGRDIREAPREWQRRIGYVPQTIGLIDDTLRSNIALGIPETEIDDVAVARALEQAGLIDFVASLAEGLETRVGEDGVRLSGGQRQRIGIARALYHDPEMLVLDEPTSALDIDTEADILGTILDPAAGRTVVMTAHRPSAIALCRRVIRLEAGRIVEDRISA